ncbi:MAG: NADH-quinone oxidoreductase subunit J [Anaerolineae bacterium]|jgi:NADH-quinone oxidoreductase subunit J|nr:NADH-quinone oxidoreductase subunit J [Anaerolineae bacterium]MDH7475787.1 NADH-quinone oxidoreductase subunit J [Anaerolineae bacterium]
MVLQAVFMLFSAMAVGAALAVVTNKNIFHSALFLVVALLGVAGLYVLLEAPFIAVVQVLIYVGAISTLILFAIMLTRRLMDASERQRNEQWFISAIVAVGLFIVLVLSVGQVHWPVVHTDVPENHLNRLGQDLMEHYVLPFEVTAVLLLAALVGAIVIARERTR